MTSMTLFKNDPILYATWLYYQDGLSQTDVAKKMGISRVTVVKYLQNAREKGIVQINLDFNTFSSIALALKIKEKFGLKNVIIIPNASGTLKKNKSTITREKLANAGSSYLNNIIEDNDVLGIAWGRTIHRISEVMIQNNKKNVSVLQMLGSMPAQPDFTTIESSSRIANKLSGQVISLHVPAIVSTAQLAMELQAEPIIRSNFEALIKCNKAFFVVGNSLDENPLIRAGVLTKQEMKEYRNINAVGVICGRFYDKFGKPVMTEVDSRILGINLAQLRKIEQRIFLAGGEKNHSSTLGAILGGYVSDLIADEDTAKYLDSCILPQNEKINNK